VLDRGGEQPASLVEIIAGVKEALDLRAVLGPLLNLVEIAIVREERIVGLLVGPIVIHDAQAIRSSVNGSRKRTETPMLPLGG